MSTERLQQIGVEMSILCADLEKAGSMNESLFRRAEGLCSELENDYGVPAFRPEVPEATQKMFFTLAKHFLVW